MKPLKNIIILLAAVLLFSCSDDFVNERLNISGVAASGVIISPEWEADNYQFECEGAGNAEFSIDSKPDWLSPYEHSGRFINDVATIYCKANVVSDFSKTGIYIDQMLISAGGKKYAVPVYYITEGNPVAQVSNSLDIRYNNYNNQLQISNSGEGILLWDIGSMPDWLTVDMNQFNPMTVMLGQGASASIPFILDAEKAALSDSLTGTLILLTNDPNKPQVEIAVYAHLGTPNLNIYASYLPVDFGATATSKALNISNNGSGILVWRFEGLPQWLNVSPSNGAFYGYSGNEIMFTCDRSKLSPGLNSATIYLKSNDANNPSYPVTVIARMPGGNANVRALEGNIVDATFDESTNILYYVSAQPNKLVAYDVIAKTVVREVVLGKAPTSLAVSEDFTKALVGHGGVISVVNLTSQSVAKTIEVTGILADIEFAADGWCAYTEGGNYNIQWTNIYWVNLSDDSVTKGSTIYEDCMIKKVPKQDYIIGSEKELSAGIYVYDINNRSEKAEFFESFKSFWFADNYIVSSNGNIYRLSDIVSKDGYISGGLSPIGNLQYSTDNYYDIPWINHCNTTHSIFALKNQDYQTVSSLIYQFEDNDYTLVNTYMYDNLYQPDAQTTAYEVEARYVFANSLGTELSVLRKGKNNNNWSVEFISVQQ